MTTSSRRVVITGLGVISPIGSDIGSFWSSLRERRSGIRSIRNVNVAGLPVRIAGEVADFDIKKYLVSKEQRKAIRMMARTIQLAVAAAELALADGAVDK